MLNLDQSTATLANINVRTEKMGKKGHRPAADLKFTVDVPSTALDDIEEGLMKALYKGTKEKGHQADMTAAPGQLTTPRFPKAKPWASTEDFPGYFAGIDPDGLLEGKIDLDKCTLKGITCQAKNGGTVALAFSLGCHPEKEDVAELYELMGKEVKLTLQAPSLGDLERLRAERPDQEDEEEDDADPSQPDLTNADDAGRAFPDAVDGRRH